MCILLYSCNLILYTNVTKIIMDFLLIYYGLLSNSIVISKITTIHIYATCYFRNHIGINNN